MDLFAFDDLYVRRLKEHDPETVDHFFQYFRSLLFVKLRKNLSDPRAIEDVTQETFIRALARIDQLKDSRKLGAFMLGICHHVLQEWYRSESRGEPLDRAHENIPGPSNTEAEFLNEETAAGVRRVLDRLSERDAAILRAVFLDDGNKDEVCRRFGVERKYLRVLLHRARERFKDEYR